MQVKHSIKANVRFLFIFCVVVMAITVGGFAIINQKQFFEMAQNDYESVKVDGYKTEIKSEVETVIAVLQGAYDQVEAGTLTEEEAKKLALETIRVMRYREDNSGYFWIDDTDYNLVMHPILTEQEGDNRYELEDQNGVFILQEIMKTVEGADAGGYNEFYFTKSDGVTVAPKMAYSELFKPWNWVVSTGNYIDDMQAEMAQTKSGMELSYKKFIRILLSLEAVVFLAMIIISHYFGDWLCNPIIQLSKAAQNVASGKIDVGIKRSNKKNEIAVLQNSFCDMIDNFSSQASAINEVAEGNLCIDVAAKSEDDVVGNALMRLIRDNNQMLLKVQNTASEIKTGSSQIAAASQSLAQGSTQQASALEQISTSVTDIADKSRMNADRVDEVTRIIGEAENSLVAGNDKMQEMVTAMGEISDASVNIQKVVKVINDIAFNTNILALNAAVEASRAGEQGKGFEVVAEEVRNLAAHAAEASNQIADLIADTIKKVGRGAELTQDTQEALQVISSSIEQIMELSETVSTVSREQAETVSQIDKALNQVSSVISNNSAASEECAASSDELSNHAGQLTEQLRKFRLK